MTKQEYETRRNACALIALADKAEKMAEIAEQRDITEHEASVLYVNGTLSRMVRTGEAKNRIEALERLENEQVESRYNTLPVWNGTKQAVKRIQKANGTDYMRIVNGKAEHVQGGQVKREHVATKSAGKFYGSIYVELTTLQDSLAVDKVYEDTIIDYARTRANEIAREYVREYMQGLSNKGKKSVDEIKNYTLADNVLDARGTPEREKAMYLYRDFPARETVSAREFVRLLKRYA